MERFRILSTILVIASLAAVCALAEGQTDQNAPVPQASQAGIVAERSVPFSTGGEGSGSAAPIEFRSSDRMSQQDRDLEARSEPAIGEGARFAGLEFNQGTWTHQQIVCPALPNHLFVQFTRNSGPGDVSAFSASIPRGAGGRVRIIPILRRGYSLFSPAPANELTVSAFNHIRAEEHPDKEPGWLATGLCYAALAGVHAEVGPPEISDLRTLQTAAPPAILEIPVEGGAVISFADMSAAPRPTEWTMTFDGKGKLMEVRQSFVPKLDAKVVDLTPAEAQGKTITVIPTDPKTTQVVAPQAQEIVVTQAPAEPQGKPVPQTPVDMTGKPVPQ